MTRANKGNDVGHPEESRANPIGHDQSGGLNSK